MPLELRPSLGPSLSITQSPTSSHKPSGSVGSSSIVDLAPGLSTIAIQRAEQRLLVEALQRLPLDLQMAIELYYWEELSVAELAEALEVPAGTVKSRLHRARELLREEMNRLPGSEQERENVRSMFQLSDDSPD